MTSSSWFTKLPSNSGFMRAAKEVSASACNIIPITARVKTPL